jgi:hypothetical protein
MELIDQIDSSLLFCDKQSLLEGKYKFHQQLVDAQLFYGLIKAHMWKNSMLTT